MNTKWLAAAAILAFVVILAWVILIDKPPQTPERDAATDSLIASHQRFRDSILAAADSSQRERDSVLSLSDARGDTIALLRRGRKVLRDSIENLIGAHPTFTIDSARCNIALRLTLAERDKVVSEADICAQDRFDLRQQIERDSAEFRHTIARLIFRVDSATDAAWYEQNKPRPCRMELDLVLAKPKLKCGPTVAATGITAFFLGLLVN